MPYSLIWEPHGVYKQFTGVVSGAELVRSVIEVAHDMRFATAQYEVSDYLGAERTEFSQDSLNEVRAVRIGSFSRNPQVRVAIVTRDPEIQQRIFSTIAARLTMHQTRIFDALTDANAWLGRSATELV
jgi:hypothetical protein